GIVVVDRRVDRVCVGRRLVGVPDLANDLAAGEDIAVGITRQVDVQEGIAIDDVGAPATLEPVAAAAAEHDVAAGESLRALREEVALDGAVDGSRDYRSFGCATEIQIDQTVHEVEIVELVLGQQSGDLVAILTDQVVAELRTADAFYVGEYG